MNEEKRKLLEKAIKRQKEDNLRVAEENLKMSQLKKEDIISDIIIRRFNDLIDMLKQKNKGE